MEHMLQIWQTLLDSTASAWYDVTGQPQIAEPSRKLLRSNVVRPVCFKSTYPAQFSIQSLRVFQNVDTANKVGEGAGVGFMYTIMSCVGPKELWVT